MIVPLVLLSFKMISQTVNPAPYCLSSYTSTSLYPEISKVELLDFGSTLLANTTSKTPAPGYTYYNNLSVTHILNTPWAKTIKVTVKNVDMETMLKVWIDYNENNVFETGELILSVPSGSVGMGMAVVHQTTFTVPNNSVIGATRMRVSLGWHYSNWGNSTFRLDSCNTAVTGDGSGGETEDYDIFIEQHEGIRQNALGNAIVIFPNPARDKIQFSSLDEKNEINIIEVVSGKVVLNTILTDEKKEVDISNLSPGIYFVRLKNERGEVRQGKFVKM
jgi:hypothetical protein